MSARMAGATIAFIKRLLNLNTTNVTFGGGVVVTGAVQTVDGRVNQASGVIMDMRTANIFKFFRSDNTTYAEIQIGNTVNSVSPTSPNRTVTMVIGGTTYYLHAKTTND